MSLRSLLYPPTANYLYHQYKREAENIFLTQRLQFKKLIRVAEDTAFGKAWDFSKFRDYEDYRNHLPIQHYEDIKSYIERAAMREPNVLWPGLPKYFAQTSGTTSGKKFIPITIDAFKSQRKGRMVAMANYAVKYNKLKKIKGPMLFFSAHAKHEKFGQYDAKLISSIMAQEIPNWLRNYNFPSAEVSQIADFATKMERIIEEVLLHRNELRGIVAFPPWLLYFLEKISQYSNATFEELFPKFSLLVTSGMSYAPYQSKVELKLGKNFDHIETYPTSEGFIGFTDSLLEKGLALMPANGVFFEFVKVSEVNDKYAKRICLEEVTINETYAILISNNAGLMSYLVGDTVKFIALDPPRMVITGRINKVISLMSENVSIHDLDTCITVVANETQMKMSEYVCFGSHGEKESLPRYQWIIESENPTVDYAILSKKTHEAMKKINALYGNYSNEGLISTPGVVCVVPGSFLKYRAFHGNLDFQQKTERICKDKLSYEAYLTFMQSNKLII